MLMPLIQVVWMIGCAAPAAPGAPSSAPVLARYAPLRPGHVATYDTSGSHGTSQEKERRQLTGALLAVAYGSEDDRRIATIYQPESADSLTGCPIAFWRVGPDGRAARDGSSRIPISCSLIMSTLFPADLGPTDERITDSLREVWALEGRLVTNLQIQTVPDRPGTGWMRTEHLSRRSESGDLSAGRGRLLTWDGKYVVDERGGMSLADLRYTAEIVDKPGMEIAIHVNVARRADSERAMTREETGRLASDMEELRTIEEDWAMARNKSRDRLDRLMANSRGSVFASALVGVRHHLEVEIARFGETTPTPYWRPAEAVDVRMPPKKPKAKTP